MPKVIWITGASSGFGMAVGLKLLEETDHIICVSARRAQLLDILVEKGAHAYPVDVTESDQLAEACCSIQDDFGTIDAVLVNAGFGIYGAIEEVPEDAVRRQFEVNVFGAVETIRNVLPPMRKQGAGRIVLTSSSAAHVSSAGMGYYSATKHGLRAIGTALRQEVKDLGIEVVMVEPGIVKTAFGQVALDENYMAVEGSVYHNHMEQVKAFMLNAFDRAPGVEQTRDIMVKALLDQRVKPIYRTTPGSLALNFASKILPPLLYDIIVKQAISKLR